MTNLFQCTKSFSITVNPGTTPCSSWITEQNLPSVFVGFDYEQQVTYQPSMNYSVTFGALPDGLSLSTSGLITGIPTVDGAFVFKITATDGACVICEQEFSITVLPLDVDCGWVIDYDIPGSSDMTWGCVGDIGAVLVELGYQTTPGACPGDAQTAAGSVQLHKDFGPYAGDKDVYIHMLGQLIAYAGTSCGTPIGNGLIQITQTNLTGAPANLLYRQLNVDGNGQDEIDEYAVLPAGSILTLTVYCGLIDSIATVANTASLKLYYEISDPIPP